MPQANTHIRAPFIQYIPHRKCRKQKDGDRQPTLTPIWDGQVTLFRLGLFPLQCCHCGYLMPHEAQA